MGLTKLKLLDEAIDFLIEKRAIEQTSPSNGYHAIIFLVPKKSWKLRPVLNVKPLNHVIVAQSLKMATLKMVTSVLHLGDFVVSLDLLHAYFHVQITPEF